MQSWQSRRAFRKDFSVPDHSAALEESMVSYGCCSKIGPSGDEVAWLHVGGVVLMAIRQAAQGCLRDAKGL